MGFLDFLRNKKTSSSISKWDEFGKYTATFHPFGKDIYKSDVVRSCVRPLATMTSKANARSKDKNIEKLLNSRPNMYMNGREFLYKVRTMYELRNNVFILIMRDDKSQVIGLYPIPYSELEGLQYNNRLYIKFRFINASIEPMVVAWDDLAVLRKDYFMSDLCGDDNLCILPSLELIDTTNQGIANAVKSTANLRGILKNTKAMLSDEDVAKRKEQFVNDYLSLDNKSGIASLDATQEFSPITMSPVTTNSAQMKEFRENVYRFYGVNENVVTGNMDATQIEAFYEQSIEPFLTDLSEELTSKIYSNKAQAFGNWIVYEANKLQFASLDKKIMMFSTVVLYGGMTINEWRAACNMSPIDDGDEPIRRLDADKVSNTTSNTENDDTEASSKPTNKDKEDENNGDKE